ncbi:hypothetical protein CJ030_MR2G024019 [Morella rubra]|uniref:Uncharacterized protein n=1 Tax=Morella rubra TaxID=262757 RepID=A0A6A1W8W1_9ROSI|nr:hypothetical protein CJ030_MR2G024019 [Morella rubra]
MVNPLGRAETENRRGCFGFFSDDSICSRLHQQDFKTIFDIERQLMRRKGKNCLMSDDDQWVKKTVATPFQEIQEEEVEEEEAEEEDPEEMEPVIEDRAKDEIPVLAFPRTPHTPTVGRSAASGSHATRLALLEASVSDLKEQTVDAL